MRENFENSASEREVTAQKYENVFTDFSADKQAARGHIALAPPALKKHRITKFFFTKTDF